MFKLLFLTVLVTVGLILIEGVIALFNAPSFLLIGLGFLIMIGYLYLCEWAIKLIFRGSKG